MPRPFAVTAVFAAVAACLGGLSVEARAQSVVLYGLIDASGSRSRPVDGFYKYALDSGAMTRSYLGFRGSEDLGGGLRAVFRLESYLRVDSGQSGRFENDVYWAREASVGFAGAFGSTVIGRTVSPLFGTTSNFNPFGESVGFSPAVRQWFGGGRGAVLGDTRWNNSLNYANNPADALRINVAYNLPENGVSDGQGGYNIGGSVGYITGPFAATIAFERVKNSALALPAGFKRQYAAQAGATYDLKFVRFYGQIGRTRTDSFDDVKATLWQVGAAVPFGTSLVLAAYGRTHAKSELLGTTDKIASLAYDYYLSKNTDVYAAASYEKLSFSSNNGKSIAAGIRHRF